MKSQATKYRDVMPGELLIEGDEWFDYSAGKWKPRRPGANESQTEHHYKTRRPLPALPEGIPPLPAGWLFYGRGPLLHYGPSHDDVACTGTTNEWDFSGWSGNESEYYYAVRAGTEMARLNALEPASQVWNFRSTEPVLPFCSSLSGRIYELEEQVTGLKKQIGRLYDLVRSF